MKNRKYWVCGIAGCILFGIGDWLLGYVDPARVGNEFFVLRAGHGADYNLMKVAVTLVSGVIGTAFLIPGFEAQAELPLSGKSRSLFHFLMPLCAVAWMVIHTTVSTGIYIYSWCMHSGNAELAYHLTVDVLGLFRPVQIILYALLAVSLAIQMVEIAAGRTVCKRSAVCFTPLIWMGVFSAPAMVLPESAFANGLSTFCMNGGMIVWLMYLTILDTKGLPAR